MGANGKYILRSLLSALEMLNTLVVEWKSRPTQSLEMEILRCNDSFLRSQIPCVVNMIALDLHTLLYRLWFFKTSNGMISYWNFINYIMGRIFRLTMWLQEGKIFLHILYCKTTLALEKWSPLRVFSCSVQSIEVEEISDSGNIYVQSDGEHLGFLPRKFRVLPGAIDMIS